MERALHCVVGHWRFLLADSMGEKGNVVGLGGVKEPRKFNLVTALAKMINLYVWPHIYVAQQTSEKGRGAKLCAI